MELCNDRVQVMDKFIKSYNSTPDGDLIITDRGVAYLSDMTVTVNYDSEYFEKCKYDSSETSRRVNQSRVDLVAFYVDSGAVLDIGIGSGQFIQSRLNTYGSDINPEAIEWLKKHGLHRTEIEKFRAFTMWDVIEHVEEPAAYLNRMVQGSYLFLSVPIFENLSEIRKSKHYRPGEHLYYFTHKGLVGWLLEYGFMFVEYSSAEIDAGRDSVGQFVFRKVKSRRS